MTKKYSPVVFSKTLAKTFIFLFFITGFCLQAKVSAAEYPVYGPRVFLRGSGAPIIETDTVTAAVAGSSYLLKISNGGLIDDTYEYVSSSVIKLNDVETLSPNELNQNIGYIEKTVTLEQLNTLSVEVRGKPGGALIINIDGIDNIAPIITANVSPQANSEGWHNADVSITFNCVDNISGIASCSSPVTVTTEGAGQIITGSAVDNAGNTAELSVTLNLDKSQPVVNISSPVEGSLLTEPDLTVIGQIVDTGSQVTASLNGEAITLQTDGSFSHPVTLLEGLNTLIVQATDKADNATESHLSVTLQTNKPPVASNLNLSAHEDVAVSFILSANDPDGDVLSYQIQTQPLHGVISAVAPNLVYTPNANFNGADSFTFKVNDGVFDSAAATVSITVNAVNDAPVANAQTVSTNEDVVLSITLTGSDIDGDSLNYSIATQPSNGVLSGTVPNLTYTPNDNFSGSDSILFVVNDGQLNSANALIDINVIAVNDLPVINSQPITSITAGEIYQYAVNAFDVDDDPLTYSLLESPDGMDVGLVTGALIWVPTTDQLGEHAVSIQVNDGRGGIGAQSFIITVSEVPNLGPEITSSPLLQGFVNEAYNYQITAQDQDGDNLSYSLTSGPTGMTLGVMSGIVHWLPNSGQIGSHSVTVRVDDGKGGYAAQSFTINVETGSNAAPVITSSAVINSLPGSLYGYPVVATDANGDVLSYVLTNAPGGMIIHGETGLINWTPTNSEIGNHNISLRVFDSKGAFGEQNYVLTVALDTTENQGPSITSTPITSVTQDETYFYDVEADDPNNDSLTYTLSQAPDNMTINPTSGEIAWTPTTEQVDSYTFTVIVTDIAGNQATQTITVTIIPIGNRPPAIINQVDDPVIYAPVSSTNPNIVMHLEFEEGFNDSSAYANNAVIDPRTSGSVITIPDVGVVGDALSIQDGLGWLTVANSSSLSMTEALTMSAWINPTGKVGNNAGVFFKGELNGTQPDWQIVVGDVGTGNTTGASGTSASINGTGYATVEAHVIDYTVLNPIPTGIWTHVAATYDGEELRLYVNGTLVNVDPHIDSIDALGSDLYIGNRFMPSGDVGGFQGLMDDLRIYDVALSQSEINSLASNKVGSKFSHQVLVSDPDIGDVHQFSLLNAPEGMAIDATTGLIEWQPSFSQIGEVTFTAVVTDSMGATDQQLITLTVTTSNSAPEITSSPADLVKIVGEIFDYTLEAFDPQGSDIQISLLDAPVGMTLDPSNVIQWTTTVAGVFNVVVRASDGELFSEQSFAITVNQVGPDNHPPIIISTPTVSVIAGQNYQYQINAYDPEGGDLQFELIGQPLAMQVNNAGLISWVTQVADTGSYNVVVRVTDLQGAYVEQNYALAVVVQSQELNHSPSFTSTPIFTARANKVYNYQVIANDADGDSLSYQLSTAPNGMTIDSNGLISWQPTDVEIGSHNVTVTVSDGRGGNVHQSYVLTVYQNGIPVITSVPSLQVIVGDEYRYQVEAVDDNGDVITFSLDTAPTGMVNDSQTGVVTWTPSASQVGTHSVVIRVTDESGAFSTQSFSLQVRLPNQTPVITSAPQQYAYVNSLYQYQVTAEDQDGDALSFELQSGPQGMAMDTTGFVSWTPTQTQIAIHQVQVRVSDGLAATIQSYQLQAFDEPGPLALWVNILPPTIAPGETTDIQLVTEGGRGYITRQLWVDGQQVALNEQGAAQVTSNVFGRHDIFARVADDIDVQTFSGVFSVTDPSDTQLPTVSIANVNNLDVVTTPIEVVGTVHDDNIRDWMFFIREVGAPQDEYTLIAEGNTNMANAPLGTFDPTLLLNGQFAIVLQATDINNQTSVTSAIVSVEGNLKVGNFSFTVQDINIPLAGIPVQVNRTYDSRRRNKKGDFGYGWTIDYQNVKVETSRELGADWVLNTYYGGPLNAIATFCVEPFSGLKATVTLPDDRVEIFDVTAVDACHEFVADIDVELQFTPTSNTLSTLRLENTITVRLFNGHLEILGSDQVYSPSLFVLTTKQGLEYHLDQNFGITQVIDTNGNTLTYSTSGIIHSSGRSISFDRDTQGRITHITPPAGDAIEYTYNLFDDLVTAGDVYGNTQYTYNNNHGLLDIVDPLGRKQLRNIYDDAGRLIAQEDTNGVRTDFTHDLVGRTSIVSDRLGRITQFAYDERGNVLSTVDALNNLTQYTYDTDDNQLSTIDALGNETSATYDDRRNQLSQSDALGHTTSFTYNQRGQELTITDALDNQFSNTYDSVGNLLSIEDPLGNIAGNNINAQGLPTLVRNAAGYDTIYTYDTFGNKLTETDHLGNTRSYTYDDNGNVLSESVQRTVNGIIVTEVTSYEYDASNRLTLTTNPEGQQTQHLYDAADNIIRDITPSGSIDYDYDVYHRLISTLYPDQSTSTKVYDAEGNLISETDRNGNTTQYGYDALNRLIKTTYADGSITQTEYDVLGRVAAEIDENSNRTEHEYDAVGRRVLTRDALNFETTFDYDANGNLISQVDANSNMTQYQYDVLDNRTKTIYPDTTENSQSYDALGQVTSKTDQNTLVTLYDYDALGRLIKVTDAVNNETSYSYDEVGNKLTQTDANAHVTSWTYDALGRETSRTLPLGQTDSSSYDASGNLQSHTDFNGQITSYQYDSNNRLTRIDYNDTTAETFIYDNEGRRTSATDRQNSTQSWLYDNRGRLTSDNKTNGDQIDYQYDDVGNRAQLTVTPLNGSAEITAYGYDVLNRLATVTATDAQVTSYAYDNVGNRASVTYSNGNVTSYSYDSLNRLEQQTTTAGLAALTDYQYTLDASGHRTQIIEAGGRTSSYIYDDLYRLTTEDITDVLNGNYSASYQYDAVGNRTGSTINGVSTLFTVDDNDRLMQQGGETFSYDDNGNTLSKAIDADITSYTYNAKNELEQADITEQGINGITSYQYDVDGIRSQKVANGETISFLTDHNRAYAQVVKETNAATGNTVSFLYGDDLIKQTRAANDSYYLYDGLGSTRALSDGIGLISNTYDYSSFGKTLNQTGTMPNDYLFTGEQYDSGLDNYYLRARYYDQRLGRFTQMDSWKRVLGESIGLNKYIYADSDPINNIDPSGNITLLELGTATAVSGIIIGATQLQSNFISLSMSGSNENKKYTTTVGFPDPLTSPPPDPGRFCEAIWTKAAKNCKGNNAGVRTCLIKAYIKYLGCKSLEKIERVVREINDNDDLGGF